MCKFVLASKSPRRKEILKGIGADFKVSASDADENIDKNLEPFMYVQELAMIKAAAAKNESAEYIIAADTVVYFKGKIMGKPHTKEEAFEMLEALSGNTHSVYTGICVCNPKSGVSVTDYEKTDVTFNKLTHDEIRRYIESGEPFDKAGGYGIQGRGALLVGKIAGDYFNVVGLPASKLNKLLKKEFNTELI